MAENKRIISRASTFNIQSDYYSYKLGTSKKFVRIMILAAALFNFILLIPDLYLIDGNVKNLCIIRIAYSLILLGVYFQLKNIKTFKLFSLVITVCELTAFTIFLYILSLYHGPNFLIQTMGIITLIILIFLVPNWWPNMVAVNMLGAGVYFIYFSMFIGFIDQTQLWAGMAYVLVAIFLCGYAAFDTEKHQFREYEAKRELEHLSSIDYLTNTANRFKMEEEAERWIKFCHRQGLPLSLVFFDIDDLKTINDQYDHFTGDSVIKDLAKLIRKQLRSSDILARWGGDEFVVLFPNITLADAIVLTERMRDIIEANNFTKSIKVTCSFGIVTMKDDSSLESLILEADHLMYTGKKLGKNHVQWNR